jgi:hypothetical protein
MRKHHRVVLSNWAEEELAVRKGYVNLPAPFGCGGYGKRIRSVNEIVQWVDDYMDALVEMHGQVEVKVEKRLGKGKKKVKKAKGKTTTFTKFVGFLNDSRLDGSDSPLLPVLVLIWT